jgi:hypothetical protein
MEKQLLMQIVMKTYCHTHWKRKHAGPDKNWGPFRDAICYAVIFSPFQFFVDLFLLNSAMDPV